MLCRKTIIVLVSLFLTFFPGTLAVAAGDQDTPIPSIDKGDEKENVKSGWKGPPGSEYNWDEIRGGSSSGSTGRDSGDVGKAP